MKKIIGLFALSVFMQTAENLPKYKVDPGKYPFTLFFQDSDADFELNSLVPVARAEEVKEILSEHISEYKRDGDVEVFLFQNGDYMMAVTNGWIPKALINRFLIKEPYRQKNPCGID
jgi:hypothetical protein